MPHMPVHDRLPQIDEQAFTETVGPFVVANIKNIVRDVSMFPVLSAESPSRSIELAYKFRRSDFVPGETVMMHSSASRPAQNELHFILAGQVAIYAQQQHTRCAPLTSLSPSSDHLSKFSSMRDPAAPCPDRCWHKHP